MGRYELHREMPRAYTRYGLSHDEAAIAAVRWAREQAHALSVPITVHAPQKQNVRDTNIDTVRKLIATGIPITYERGGVPGGGVVIALWATRKMLDSIERSASTDAVAAITWAESDTRDWAAENSATLLG